MSYSSKPDPWWVDGILKPALLALGAVSGLAAAWAAFTWP